MSDTWKVAENVQMRSSEESGPIWRYEIHIMNLILDFIRMKQHRLLADSQVMRHRSAPLAVLLDQTIELAYRADENAKDALVKMLW